MIDLIKTISKKEWIFVGVLTLVILAITTLPYLLGYFFAPEGMIYNGLHALSPGDVPVYYSYINQVIEGNYFVKDLFTSESQDLGTFNVWWFWVGLMAKLFNLSPIFAFHLSRVLLVPFATLTIYLFLSYIFSDKAKRMVSYFFALFSSGVGFYFAAPLDILGIEGESSYHWPIDLWLTESNTFNAIFQTSHFIASLVLMLLIFLLMIKAFEKKSLGLTFLAGILGLAYFNFHPYYLPVIYGVLTLYLFMLMVQVSRFLWKESFQLILLMVVSFPSAVYHFWLIRHSEVIGTRALQNVTNISPLIYVLMGYGFLVIGFLLGLYFLIKNKKLNNKYAFLLIWFFVNVIFIYSPFPFHSRYTQGLHIILVIFTVVGLFEVFNFLKFKLSSKTFDFWINNKALWLMLFLVCFFPSTLYSVSRDVKFFVSPGEEVIDKVFLPVGYVDVFEYLNNQPKGQVVLGSDIPSKFIPGLSGQSVYIAHAHETLFFESKLVFLLRFYGTNNDDESKIRFLQKSGIDYVVYGDYEKQMGDFNPSEKSYLDLVYESSSFQVYKVVLE